MLKKIIQIASLVGTLAVAGGIPAYAGTYEEDAAAPAGSFTMSMPAPAGANFEAMDRRARHERFAMRARNDRFFGEHRVWQGSEDQK